MGPSPSLFIVFLLLVFSLGSAPSSSFQIPYIDRGSYTRLLPTAKAKAPFSCVIVRSTDSFDRKSSINSKSRLDSSIISIVDMGASSSSNIFNLRESTKREFRQKSILLTGASRGLGKSIAHALSTCQPALLILSGRDEKALKEVQEECMELAAKQRLQQNSNTSDNSSTLPTRIEIVVCDLGQKHSVEKLGNISLQLAKKYSLDGDGGGTIDILINNGGISSRSSFLTTDLDVDEKLMQVNFFSGVALAKALVPGMVTNGMGGKVIWISSVQGKLGTPFRTSYAASKFAVQGYCESLRSELALNNITVHIVSPGYIRTNLSMSAIMGDGSAYRKMDETTANGADPDDVATTILDSVASGKSDFLVAATFSAKAAMWLKFFAPSFLEKMLIKRFKKQKLLEDDT